MSLSDDAVKRLMIATSDADIGNEIASAINNGTEAATQGGMVVAAQIEATSVSQSTDFGALELGDKILRFPAVAGGLIFHECQDLYASGTVTYGTSSGAQTCTINGTQVSFADAGTDAGNATALAAAITGNATLAAIVTAEVDGGVPEQVNITSILPGTVGNYTLAVTGTGATRSGATLTGGATAGELPVAAVVGDMYVVLRSLALEDTDVVF